MPSPLSHPPMAALTLIHGEGEKLVPEHLVHEPIWPVERQVWGKRRPSQPCLVRSTWS